MGTGKLVFAEVLWGATGSHVTGSDVSHVTGNDHARKYVLRMRNRRLRHIRPSGTFWPEVTKSRDRKRPFPEVFLTGSRFCACPAFPRVFFLSSSNMATGCDRRLLDPFGVPMGVRNRKLRNTLNDRRSCDPFGNVHGVFSTTSASYNHRKPRVLYLAWLLELALVICPFCFHIVSI